MVVDETFLRFEEEVMMKILLEEDISKERNLIRQYKNSKVINREYTGHGFFTYYKINDKSYSICDNVNLQLGNINANINDLKYGVGFIVFIRNGLISFLEAYTYGEVWPEKIYKYEFF